MNARIAVSVMPICLLLAAAAGVTDAAHDGGRERFRAIVLTTITTVAGMTPLLAIPSLYLIGNDIRRVIRWLLTGQWPTREQVALRGRDTD